MPILYQKYITRQDLRDHPDWLYLFGDNLQRRGLGGQAKEMRGEPNAVGIVTKKKPSREDDAYLTDDEYDFNISSISGDLIRVQDHLKEGGTVVIPEDGIGTGYAEMMPKCPKTFAFLSWMLYRLRTL